MMTFKEFKTYYNKFKRCPNDSFQRKNPLNDKQLLSRYKKYVDAKNKTQEKINEIIEDITSDKRWMKMREEVFKRDDYYCRLIAVLSKEELALLKTKTQRLLSILDPAHVFKVGSHPQIKYNMDYVVTLNRYSHGLLDSGKHPITGKMINQDELVSWWKRIVGSNTYEKLKEGVRKWQK